MNIVRQSVCVFYSLTIIHMMKAEIYDFSIVFFFNLFIFVLIFIYKNLIN